MYNSPTSFRVSFRDVFLRPIIKTHLLKEEADTSFHPLKFITSQPFLPLDSTHLRRWQLGVFPVGRRAPFSAMHSQPVTHHHGGAVLQSKASRSREVLRGEAPGTPSNSYENRDLVGLFRAVLQWEHRKSHGFVGFNNGAWWLLARSQYVCLSLMGTSKFITQRGKGPYA